MDNTSAKMPQKYNEIIDIQAELVNNIIENQKTKEANYEHQ